MTGLVVTADDFGVAREVNQAVEQAHRSGILTAASLMVAAPWAQDAIARARRMPQLRVGLHLVLVDGKAALPREELPHIADANGLLPNREVDLAFRMVLNPAVRRELAQEIRAQFLAFAQTGLHLDHVNAHKHFHLHPMIARMIMDIGKDFGLAGFRVPVEPFGIADDEASARSAGETALHYWAKLIRARARAHGLLVPDRVYGLHWSGEMTQLRLLRTLASAPRGGITEIYTHPAACDAFPGCAPTYKYTEELAALCSPEAIEAVSASHFHLGGYSDQLSSSGHAACAGSRAH